MLHKLERRPGSSGEQERKRWRELRNNSQKGTGTPQLCTKLNNNNNRMRTISIFITCNSMIEPNSGPHTVLKIPFLNLGTKDVTRFRGYIGT